MAKLTVVPASKREEAIAEATKDGKAQSLAGGLNLPEGKYPFTVADKKAFGLLEVTAGDGKNWVLPIVAGSMKVNGKTENFILSDAAGAKTLVIPDSFYTAMSLNSTYEITIGKRKGRSVVTSVEAMDAIPAGEDDE